MLIWLVVFSAPADAADVGGANAAEFLRIGAGARAPAMGDAWTARAEGAGAMHYNPAGLGMAPRHEILLGYQNLIERIAQGDLAYARPIDERSGWGLHLRYLSYGKTDRTTVSTVGANVTVNTAGTFSGADLAGGLSYGRRMGDWAWGLTGKVISLEIDNATATGFAADAGLMWRARRAPFAAGLVVKNLGTRLKFDRQSEEFPLLVRGGVATWLYEDRIRLHADVEKVRDGRFSAMTGGEFWLTKMLALRAGYDGRARIRGENLAGLTVGAGFRHEAISLDYSYMPFGDFGDNHRIGLTWQFGGADGE